MNGRVTIGILCLLLAAGPLSRAGATEGVARDEARTVERDLVRLAARVSKAYVMIGGGSGVVISPDGWMLTNDHVIDQQRKKKVWSVMMPIKKRFKADLIGKDVTGDIALLKIRSSEPLPFLPLGDSDALLPGQLVVALGNPFSHAFRTAEPTVTLGIVSAVHRNQGTYSDAIQTDAAINPGNSGGPLINLGGEVVGINGRGRMRFSEKNNTGVALAIPANQIRLFLPLLKKGDVHHGHVTGLDFVADARGENSLAVKVVRPGSVAERAGFRPGDRILAVGKLPVWNFQRFEGAVHAFPEGAKLPLRVRRGDRDLTLEATLIRWYPGGSEKLRADPLKPGLGVELNPKPPITGGAEIREVLVNSAASKGGLRAGDIILRFEGKQVLGPGDLEGMLEGVYALLEQRRRKDAKVTLHFLRGLEEKEVTLTLGPKPKK